MAPSGDEFMGPGRIYIRNKSGNEMHAFVSKYNGGNDDWFLIPAAFDEVWNREKAGWELVAFKDDAGTRVGFYRKVGDVTTYVTFHSFSNVEIHQVSR